MQRCFFLFCFFLAAFSGKGQKADILSTEFSLYYHPGQRFLKARSLLEIHKLNEPQLHLSFIPDSIIYIRFREGRLKGNIPYTKEGNTLKLFFTRKDRAEFEVEIGYYVDVEDEQYNAFIIQTAQLFSVNPYNPYRKDPLSLSGMLFPEIENDETLIRVNLSFPERMNMGTIGSAEFRIVGEAGMISEFWSTEKPVMPKGFFLFIGTFSEFSLKDLDTKYAFSEMDISKVKAMENRERYMAMIRYFQAYTKTETDMALSALDSLAAIPLEGFYLTSHDDEGDDLQKEKWLALLLMDKDTGRASYLHFLYKAKQKGLQWKNAVLDKKWEMERDTSGPVAVRRIQAWEWISNYDSLGVERYLKGDSLFPGTGPRREFLRSIVKGSPPHLTLDYRYRDNTQYIYLTQDTSRAGLYRIPLNVEIYTQDSSLKQFVYTQMQVTDTISFPLTGSPRAVKVDFGSRFPGFVKDNSPDTYYLYQLSNATTNEERISALRHLFKTKNQNLFSTALGIAMDDNNPNVRLEAVENAADLPVPAQLKLKETLLKLASSDPDSRVKSRAKILVDKYYGK